MSEVANDQIVDEKPADVNEKVKFPPFPDPTVNDFDADISEEERQFYKDKFTDLNTVTNFRLHCTACDRHLGSSAQSESRMRSHPMLRTLMCQTCHTFYNSGEFEKGDDGSELYCRWCGQGGQVYCCAGCPHVFCAKCVKRNLGLPKIKEIENNDDWKCFKCNPTCLWNLRAICWALLRYCAFKNKITYGTEDVVLKQAYQKDCATDSSKCCKHKLKRRSDVKKKEDNTPKRSTPVMAKLTPTIQVKKFASITPEEKQIKVEKKPLKRSASPKNRVFIKNPIAITPIPKIFGPVNMNINKKIKIQNTSITTNMRIGNEKGLVTYANIRPKTPYNFQNLPIVASHQFNGGNIANDNINLSLESLTQGLDMSAVASIANSSQKDDVVCTPDFPLEPLCEVTEDAADDDVQCMTPAPVASRPSNPQVPPLARINNVIPDLSPDNIIQMTENDVTVNASTGGLKFRVDPQTLSSQKMYRLPDGRIFAINSNPNMPGGYSATIVAVTENAASKVPKGVTYAAKLSAVPLIKSSTPTIPIRNAERNQTTKRKPPNPPKRTANKISDSARILDFNVPIEWFRYNLIDAVDALEYALPRLQKLKKECSTLYLRNRSVDEMRDLTKVLERLLTTSSTRFTEINESLQNDLRQYMIKKVNGNASEDDDVEILPSAENDDPIFIDENSVESNALVNECQEVDLTSHISSELNDSVEKSTSNEDPFANIDVCDNSVVNQSDDSNITNNEKQLSNNENNITSNSKLPENNREHTSENPIEDDISANLSEHNNEDSLKNKDPETKKTENSQKGKTEKDISKENINDTVDNNENGISNNESTINSEKIIDEAVETIISTNSVINNVKVNIEEDKTQDAEMTEEMINSLLEDDKDDQQDVEMDTDN